MNATQYQMRRHPFITGVTLLILSPFLLAAALLWIAAFTVAVAWELLAGGRR